MNIGQASKTSGVSAKMIRYYEAIGLLPEADRRESGYRDYCTADIHRLAFVRRARDLGFSMEQIRALLSLWSDTSRSDAEVRAVASAHVAELEAQAEKLQGMIGTLRHLIGSCRRGDRPHCPIITELAGGIAEGPARRTRKPAAKRH
ncbi:MAG TPA: Cu(I)-responsive transcriptional regulator [Xanthobacteraceae bacterium]